SSFAGGGLLRGYRRARSVQDRRGLVERFAIRVVNMVADRASSACPRPHPLQEFPVSSGLPISAPISHSVLRALRLALRDGAGSAGIGSGTASITFAASPALASNTARIATMAWSSCSSVRRLANQCSCQCLLQRPDPRPGPVCLVD